MTLIVGLILGAFVLFTLELIAPGGILGVAGGLLIVAASVLTYQDYGFFSATAVLLGGTFGGVALFFLEIKLISSTPLGKHLRLESSIASKLNPKDDDSLVGEEGVTLTTLAPSGKVRIGEKTYTASAADGFLEKGTPIHVLRTETFKIIVSKK